MKSLTEMFKKTPKGRDCGLSGAPAEIRAQAMAEGNYMQKLPLLQGCLEAFDAGRPENLRHFLAAYLEFKRANGNTAKLHAEGVDDGFVALVSKPVTILVERSTAPLDTLEAITQGLSEFYRQVVLDIGLRHAVTEGAWSATEAYLKAGADPNCGQGRALYNAVRNNHGRIVQQLAAHGADFDALPPFASPGYAAQLAAAKARYLAATAPQPDSPPADSTPAAAPSPAVKTTGERQLKL